MKRRKTDDDIGFDEHGNPIALGDDAGAQSSAIVEDPRATPILVVAMLDGSIGVRVYGPPDSDTADLLEHLARTYRAAVDAARRRD